MWLASGRPLLLKDARGGSRRTEIQWRFKHERGEPGARPRVPLSVDSARLFVRWTGSASRSLHGHLRRFRDGWCKRHLSHAREATCHRESLGIEDFERSPGAGQDRRSQSKVSEVGKFPKAVRWGFGNAKQPLVREVLSAADRRHFVARDASDVN